MASLDPEAKRAGIEKLVKIGLIGVTCVIVGPYAWLALEGAFAIAAFGAAVLLAWGAAPSVAQFVANKRIAMLKAVIEANPIETMQTLYAEKLVEFQRQEQAVTEFDAQFNSVSNMVDQLKDTDPAEAPAYIEMRDKMREGLTELRGEQAEAQKELKNAKFAIDKMKRLWTVGCAMNKALAASASAQSLFFQQLKQDVAVDTVRNNLYRAFANLNTAVERRKNNALFAASKPQPALTEGAATKVIDLGRVEAIKVAK